MKKTILIVDDDADIRSTLKTILQKNGYAVTTAVNGSDCLKKLENGQPDLVLLDVMMPGVPTKEIIKKIKGKIAMITAVMISEAEREELFQSKNIVEFIQKPFDLDDLLKRIKKIIPA